MFTSLRQPKLVACRPDDHGCTNVSNVGFNSLPPMHINEQINSEDMRSTQNQNPRQSDPGGKMYSQLCTESTTYVGSPELFMKKVFPSNQMEGYAEKKLFAPHWSLETVNDAIEVSLRPVLMHCF